MSERKEKKRRILEVKEDNWTTWTCMRRIIDEVPKWILDEGEGLEIKETNCRRRKRIRDE
jgi:hypothetical protein